jgi:dihydroorotase
MRVSLMGTALLLVLAASTAFCQYDLLIKGGHVVDPAGRLDGVRDVAVAGGKVALVAPSITASKAKKVVDAAGLYVTPGLVDIHAHVYPRGTVPFLSADAGCLPSGVTTAVDAGSSGPRNFADFKSRFIDHSQVRILAWLNIVSVGSQGGAVEQDITQMDPQATAAVVKKYPQLIVGVKTAHYWPSHPDAKHPAWAAVDRAIEAAALSNTPVMVDFRPVDPERPYSDLILKKLRPGDIHTHIYASHFDLVDPRGRLRDYMIQARKRGVWFDLGHGGGSFWFRSAEAALRAGFPPDSISTDLHIGSYLRTAFNMTNVMSKMLNLGMALSQVVERVTVNPAREIRRPELGTLAPGAAADIAVFELRKGRFGFVDCGGERRFGEQKLECLLTMREGKVVYDPTGLAASLV